MRDYSPFEIADLIFLKLNGTLNPDKELELDEWIRNSERNRLLYEQLLTNGNDPGRIKKIFADYDYSGFYAECCRKIEASQKRGYSRPLKIAASILLLGVLSSSLFFTGILTRHDIMSGDIAPGTSAAVLILSDGEKVLLGDKQSAKEIEKDNLIVENDTLKYSGLKKNKIDYNTIIIPRGGEYVVRLSDGTKIWLNAESELRYPVSFMKGERTVYLKGEAFFDVEKDPDSPFTVVTGEHKVTVLGTEFCVRAYPDEKYIMTTLERGKVSVKVGDRHIDLLPGQQSNVNNNEMIVKDVNTTLYTAWHNNKYVFDNQPLREILQTLSRWYDMEVNYDIQEFGDIRFTGELTRYTNILDFLKKLEELEKVHFSITDKRVTVSAY
jgi:hypothetical protein